MKTNYQNLTAYEAIVVGVALLGVALIGLQFYVAMPEKTKAEIVDALQVLDMHDAWQTQIEVNQFVFGGMEEFYRQFYIAAGQVFEPVGQDAIRVTELFGQGYQSLAQMGESIASNYQNNYAASGVEDGVGGKVLGAYLEKLLE